MRALIVSRFVLYSRLGLPFNSENTRLLDQKVARIIIGFALQNALVNDVKVDELVALYSSPDLERARKMYEQLSTSTRHYDREISIWLQQLFEQTSPKTDPKELITDLRKTEFLLFMMLNRSGDAQNSVNDWMNYIVNAAESLADGYWMDTKILLSQALEVSHSEQVEQLKLDRSIAYEIDTLQRATLSYFQEALTYPSRMATPDEATGDILNVQVILLDLLQLRHRKKKAISNEMFAVITQRLNAAVRNLMKGEKDNASALQEMKLAVQYMNENKNLVTDREGRRLISESAGKIEDLLRTPNLQEKS